MTAQAHEFLFINGKRNSMCSCPLDFYLKFSKISRKIVCSRTSLWRGYVGTWEIIDNRLYLIDILGAFSDGSSINLDAIFPGYPDRVFAHWYSGLLRIPQGEIIRYEHMGFGSIYESDLFMSIEKGVVINEYKVKNCA